MIPVIAHSEQTLNDPGDPLSGPQVGAVTVRKRTAQQLAQEPGFLALGEQPWPTRRRANLHASLTVSAMAIDPAHHGTGRTAQSTRHGVQRQPLLHQRQRSSPTRLQHFGRTGQPHDHLLVEASCYCIHCAEVNRRDMNSISRPLGLKPLLSARERPPRPLAPATSFPTPRYRPRASPQRLLNFPGTVPPTQTHAGLPVPPRAPPHGRLPACSRSSAHLGVPRLPQARPRRVRPQ